MNGYCSAITAAVAAACLGGAAHAEGTTYYFNGTAIGAYTDTVIDSTGRYDQSTPVLVVPAPEVRYVPVRTQRSNTTYYYSGSNHEHTALSSPGYTTYYEPRLVYPTPVTTYYYRQPDYAAPAQPQGYVPPGLSIVTPAGTYAPFYGGWNSYSMENAGGYNAYRDTAY